MAALLFLNLSPLHFDVTTPEKEPLGGTESAVCYLTRALAARGHRITLVAGVPKESDGQTILGVRHRHVDDAERLLAEQWDAVVLVNAVDAAPLAASLTKAPLILWCHMMPDQHAMRNIAENHKQFAKIVFVAAHQRKAFGLDGEVIGNGIAPAFENMFSSAAELLATKQCRAAYTSTPYRGLGKLLQVLDNVDIHCDVFSSMRVYQNDDDGYGALIAMAKSHPRVTYHGAVSQPELAKALRSIAFLSYPCTFQECHSVSILEAQAAGMCVVTTPAATDDDRGCKITQLESFDHVMEAAIKWFNAPPVTRGEDLMGMVSRINATSTWAVRAGEWEAMLA